MHSRTKIRLTLLRSRNTYLSFILRDSDCNKKGLVCLDNSEQQQIDKYIQEFKDIALFVIVQENNLGDFEECD